MGLFNFIRGEFIEVIDWKIDGQDTMVSRCPIDSKQQIKKGAQLIVAPSQVAIFVYEGKIVDVYESGRYMLDTDTMPIMTSLSNWEYAFENYFKADIYFVNMKQFINQKWGTMNPIMMRDAEFGMIRIRGFGVYSFKVKEPVVFLREVFGSNRFFSVNQINEHLKSLIISTASDTISEARIPVMELASYYEELSAKIMGNLDIKFNSYGLTISDFAIENLSLPDSVERAIDKRGEMGIIGGLNNYMQYQATEAIRDAAQNESNAGAGLGVGMAAGVNMAKAMSGVFEKTDTEVKHVSEEGLRCLQCGEKISENMKYCAKCGAVLTMACVSCQKPLAPGSKFCTECGANQQQKRQCPSCQYELNLNSKFCPNCGKGLSE